MTGIKTSTFPYLISDQRREDDVIGDIRNSIFRTVQKMAMDVEVQTVTDIAWDIHNADISVNEDDYIAKITGIIESGFQEITHTNAMFIATQMFVDTNASFIYPFAR